MMIVKENITVYICQHCKKRMFRKHAMELHELSCYSNPENFRACSACINLQEIPASYWVDGWDGGREVKTKGFRCTKLDKILFPYKVEKMGLNTTYPESFEGQEPMPNICEHQQPF